MRYRKLDANGDYSFGHITADFYKDSPEAVAQAVRTRLDLWLGDWYLDTSDGTPYKTQVLGERTKPLLDAVIQQRILRTTGVNGITAYSSNINVNTRRVTIQATVNTIYGAVKLSEVING